MPRSLQDELGLDTSVILRLLVGAPAKQFANAVAFLEHCAAQNVRVVVSDLVICETYFALQHHYGVPKAQALNALDQLFDSGDVHGTGVAPQVLKTPRLSTATLGFADRVIHAQYQERKASLASFEKASKKLPNALVI